MTEAEWETSTDPMAMGEVAVRGKRASERVLQLYMVAYWGWYADQERSKADWEKARGALAILERWAETGIKPPEPEVYSDDWAIWFSEETPEAFLSTIANSVFVNEPDRRRAKRAIWTLRDIFGNPFRPVAFSPSWRTDTTVALAKQVYESRDFSAMPILADALQDAGCEDEQILHHCRDANQPHARGCWVVDLVLGKE